ncbi:MAG: caspase domain-containing protein [Smithellaceae bacterium]
MKRVGVSLLIALSFFLVTFNSFSEERALSIKDKNQRLALVIGNSKYTASPLKNPVNDARGMSAALQKLGFRVIYEENATRRVMDEAIRTFYSRLRNGETGLFYYAGHGMQVKGRNYLIPVDARIETESDVEHESIDLGRVLGKMEDAGNPVNIVILDACRDNPFAKSFRSSGVGLARIDAPVGTIIAYATAPESVAADGTGQNGVYTKYLLKEMMIPGLTIEQVFKAVRNNVIDETNSKQIPWESTSLRGDFYFRAPQATDSCLVKCSPNTRPLEELMQLSQGHLTRYNTLKKEGKHNSRESIEVLREIICDFRHIEDTLQNYYDSTHDEDAGKTQKNMAQTRNKYEEELCGKISR